MPGDVDATRTKVQRYLTKNFNNVNIDEDGDFSLRNGSSRIFVNTMTRDEVDFTMVMLEIPLLFHIDESPELFEYLALHGNDYLFGHLSAKRGDDGVFILYSHALLGDYLDEDELCRAVGAMLGTADDLDDELMEKFGGTRFHSE